MGKVVFGIEFETEECCQCGIPFAMPADFRRRALSNHQIWFYCPMGHRQHYAGKTPEQKLREELDKARSKTEALELKAAALKEQRDGVARTNHRMRQRIRAGVCPCCNRNFEALGRHIRDMHPEFGTGQTLRLLRENFGLTQKALAEEALVTSNHVSRYENGKPVPQPVGERLMAWADANS